MNKLLDRDRKRSFIFGLAAFIIVSLLAPSVSEAGEGDSEFFIFSEMEMDGQRHDRVAADVNGDGLLDLAMIYTRSDMRDKNFFRWCLHEKGKGFTGKCGSLEMPREARAFDLGDVDGDKSAELVIIDDSGVSLSRFEGDKFGTFKEISGTRAILSGAHAERPILLRFLWDLDKDGKKEIVIPTLDGPFINSYDGSGLKPIKKIDSPAFVAYKVGSLGDIMATDDINQFLIFRTYEKRTTVKYTAPDVFIEDFNGDGRLDLITLVDNTLRVFLQGKDGSWPDKPAVKEKRSILPPEERGLGFAGEAMTFADLNGDGLGDIIMMKWGTSEERTQMDRYIYYARPGLKFEKEPDQKIRSESAAVDFGIYDLNNDDKLDLVIPFFHFAPAQAFKVITENAIKVQFRLFLMRPDGRYGQDAGKTFAKVDRRVLLNYKIDVIGMIFDFRSLIEGNFHPLINFGGDYNGDGYLDLIADTGGDKLTFYWGNAEANYERLPDHSVQYESATDFDLVDLNGDGKTDIVTYYESEERTQKRRELAKKARAQGGTVQEFEDEAAMVMAPEGTRVKALISK